MFRWVSWIYGAFFLALGVLFLYWSGRGLVAYEAGVRAAWSDPGACVAGLAAAGLSLWAAFRLVSGGVDLRGVVSALGISRELQAAVQAADKLRQTDPAAAGRLLDGYFMKEAAATEGRRAALRQRAPFDLDAAVALQRELQEDLKTNAVARTDLLKNVPEAQRATVLAQIDSDDQNLKSELSGIEQGIQRLRLR